MTFLEALAATRGQRLLARPARPDWRGGYYIRYDGQLIEIDPLKVGATGRPVPMVARMPAIDTLLGEWETIER